MPAFTTRHRALPEVRFVWHQRTYCTAAFRQEQFGAPCPPAASRRPGLSRNWTPALSCATATVLALKRSCSYCQFSEKLSEYPVWITFLGLSGPERASNRQTQAPSTT